MTIGSGGIANATHSRTGSNRLSIATGFFASAIMRSLRAAASIGLLLNSFRISMRIGRSPVHLSNLDRVLRAELPDGVRKVLFSRALLWPEPSEPAKLAGQRVPSRQWRRSGAGVRVPPGAWPARAAH